MDEARFVILGGGMVAGYAAKQFVESGLKAGELAIISADTVLPYERPPLSKGFLAGNDTEDSILIKPADFYRDHGIEVRLGCEVSAVDVGRRRLALKTGGEFGFRKLVVATGARPRTFETATGLRNLFYLRTLDDSKAIRGAAEGAKRAAVIGGGFIGMEVAAVLAQKSVEVTMILHEDRLGKKIFTPEVSAFFERYYEARGVRFTKLAMVSDLGRNDGAIRTVLLDDGREVPCDIAIAGIGVKPVTDLLAGSAIELGDGIMVNEYLETNQPDILAAGDVASYQDVLFNKRRRVEHWDNAVSQGQHCARELLGDRAPFRHVPYFFSDVFDLSYEYWGDASGADSVATRGDITTKSFSVWWLSGQHLVAVLVMNRPDDERTAAPHWIESKRPVDGRELQDTSHGLS